MPKYTGRLLADEWTEEAILTLLYRVEELANNSGAHFIGSLLLPFKVSRKAYGYWRLKFAASRRIAEQMDLIDTILETRLVEDGMSGKIKSTMALYCLKCFHAGPAPVPPVPETAAPVAGEAEAGPERKTEYTGEQVPVTIEMPDGKVIPFPFKGDRNVLPKEGFWAAKNWLDDERPG